MNEREARLHNSSDARLWAREFAATLTEHPEIDPKDEGFMLGWFANAMMAALDEREHQNAKAGPVVARN